MPLCAYLAASMTYRDEAPYLREWIEFHQLVGVERFFLYDTGEHGRARRGTGLTSIAASSRSRSGMARAGRTRQSTTASRPTPMSRWIVFIDADEFLFSPVGRPLPDVLLDFEEFPGVGVNRAQFATSGHVSKPNGLVIENYIYRFVDGAAKWVKCIVQPARARTAVADRMSSSSTPVTQST